ncbi:unnamed protein product [Prunus brigantina]
MSASLKAQGACHDTNMKRGSVHKYQEAANSSQEHRFHVPNPNSNSSLSEHITTRMDIEITG